MQFTLNSVEIYDYNSEKKLNNYLYNNELSF